MAVPQTKAELLKAIEVQFAKLMRELEKVPDDKYREPTLDAHTKGTTMSVGDLVAYLIGWGELVVKWIDRDQRGEPVDFPETGYKWNELGKLAQKFYGDSQALSASELLTRLRRSKKNAGSDDRVAGRPCALRPAVVRQMDPWPYDSVQHVLTLRQRLRPFAQMEEGPGLG